VLINMFTSQDIASELRIAGWKARVSASKGEDVVLVDGEPGRVRVRAQYAKTMLAVWLAEQTAEALREAGYVVEAEDNKTFFYVTGSAV
jgi:hypothetical protein